jgi:O-antigen biosynthesis protein
MSSPWGAVVLCSNQANWIGLQLETLYPHVSEIVVVDGAVTPEPEEGFSDSNPSPGRRIEPSVDGSIDRVRSFPDPEDKIRLLQETGAQAEALNRARERLRSPMFLVVGADEFLSDLPETLWACERAAPCEAFFIAVLELRGGGDRCLRKPHPVLVAGRNIPSFSFTGSRSIPPDIVRELVDDVLLRYGRIRPEGPGEPGDRPVQGTQLYLNEHPPAVAAWLERIGRAGFLPKACPSGESDPAPLVSIVVPFRDQVDMTRRCVREILCRTAAQPGWELILQDDGSTEDTSSLKALADGEQIRLQRNAENLGFLRTINAAARSVRGRYIVFLNNDTLPRCGWLEQLVATAERDPKTGVVGSMLLYPDGRLQEAGGILFQDGRGCNYGRDDSPYTDRYNYLREVDYCSGAAMLVRRDLFLSAGGFDERYAPAYYEDADLCFEARKQGYKVVFQPRSRVVHLEGATCGTDLESGVKRHQTVNRSAFEAKWREALQHQQTPDRNVHVLRERTQGKHFLVADTSFPHFDRDAGSFRLFQMIKLLRDAGQRVTFFACDSPVSVRHRKALEELGVATRIGKYHCESEVKRRYSTRPRLMEIALDTPIDIAVLSRFATARRLLPLLRRDSPCTRIVTDSVDVHFRREQRQAELLGNQELFLQAEQTRRRELKAYRQSDLVIAISENEAEFLRGRLPRTRVCVVPMIHPVPTTVPGHPERKDILFIGSLGHPPNRDAIQYLLADIMPRVWERLPAVRLRLAGVGHDGEIRIPETGRVDFLGFVDDLTPVLNAARLLVAPLRFGAGVKGKIVQSLANGIPVVTTEVGAEGLDLSDGGDVLLAHGPEAFAERIVRVYQDPVMWRHLSDSGRKRITERFSPEAVRPSIEQNLIRLERFRPGLRRKFVSLWNRVG